MWISSAFQITWNHIHIILNSKVLIRTKSCFEHSLLWSIQTNFDTGYWPNSAKTVERHMCQMVCSVLIMIYNTLILPYLSYCSEIWGNTYERRLHDLIVLQTRAIRIIGDIGFRDHTSKVFKKFECLKLVDIIYIWTMECSS